MPLMNDEQIKLELDRFVGLEDADRWMKQRWDGKSQTYQGVKAGI